MDIIIARKPPWRRWSFAIAAGLLLVGGLVFWALSGATGNVYRVPIDRLTIATVKEGAFEDYVAVRATVAPFTIGYLTTDQGGTVKQVLVEDGASVKSGQPLIVLSNPALQLQVAAQQLVFEQTRFKYERDIVDIEHQIGRLKINLERDKILLDGNAISPSTYKQEVEEYDYYIKLKAATIASHKIVQKVQATQLIGGTFIAGSHIDVANASVEALTIRAPMDGYLTALDAEVGESKAVGAVLGQVNSTDHFKLTAQVDEFYLGSVTLGQPALFSVDAQSYRAKIAKVYPQVTNGTFKVDLHLDTTAVPGVHVGQAIDLKVQFGNASRAMTVANGPFFQDSGGSWVFVLTPDGHSATRRAIKSGRRNPDVVEVIDGLKPGEKVIISSYEAFRTIDRVEFQQSTTAGFQ